LALTLPTPIPLVAGTVGVVVTAAVARTVDVEGLILHSVVDIAAEVVSPLVVAVEVCFDWITGPGGSLSRASRLVLITTRPYDST
jgi:hypothetical protein